MGSKTSTDPKGISNILVKTYADMEIQFAKQHPNKVSQEFFLQSLAPLFAQGPDAVDWALAHQKAEQVFEDFFSTADFSQYGNNDDIYFFVIAINESTGNPLGILQFLISPEFPYGTVKACYFGVEEAAKNNGLEILLMSSIFKILPLTNRLFLHTRSTNLKAITAYQAMGFKQFDETMPHWPDFEYLAEDTVTLQKVAEQLQ